MVLCQNHAPKVVPDHFDFGKCVVQMYKNRQREEGREEKLAIKEKSTSINCTNTSFIAVTITLILTFSKH